MNLAALPRVTGAGFHALFMGADLIAVQLHVVDDAALQAALPRAGRMIRRELLRRGDKKDTPGRSAAFVITDPPPLPEGIDPKALTVALTFVKD